MRARIVQSFGGPGVSPDEASSQDCWPHGAAGQNGAAMTPAAVLVPLVFHDGGVTVLLTQRTDTLKSHSGQISFPGGRWEKADKTPEDTALRETEEEIGLPREHIELIGRLSMHETGTGYRVMPVVGLIAPPFPLEPAPAEVAEVFEVPLEHVLEPSNHRTETRLHRGSPHQFCVMPYNDYYIWGLTARLLLELSQRIAQR